MTQGKKYSPIAVVGMSCRFPGNVNSPEQYWKLLMSGTDAIQDVPADRWNQDYFYSEDRAQPGSLINQQGGFIHDVAGFDNSFFGFSNLEAANMDPQQRLLLQVSWEAMEQGAVPASNWAGKQVGVFMGCFTMDYHVMQFLDPMEMGAFASTGIMNNMLANRISYAFDFKGPSIAMDTACSASLTAVHQACRSLQCGDSDMALAGGSMLMLIPEYHIAETKTGILSKDARCKSFSAAANGYVRSEGVGVVVLKRLDDAIASGDQILGTIIGSAVNQDGHTNGITLPNGQAQMAVMRAACDCAGITSAAISYVEAHGTGTFSGDPIEARSIGSVFGSGSGRREPLWIGSCKSNIGHTESASGVAGLIKTILCLRHKQIPPNLHLEQLNPVIPFDQLLIRVPVQPQSLDKGNKPLIAGVNSFGFGGSNAHVLVSEYQNEETSTGAKVDEVKSYILPISARSEKALKSLAAQYADTLEANNVSAANICANAGMRRSQLSRRKAFAAVTKNGLIAQLRGYVSAEPVNTLPVNGNKLIWIFSGVGKLFFDISKKLLNTEPIFRDMYLQCNEIYKQLSGFSLLDKLNHVSDNETINDLMLTHPAQFFHQVSMSALWRARGIKPDAIVGYSAGEFAAFYEAGVFTLEQCLEFIYRRTMFLKPLEGIGAMVAVNAGEDKIAPLLQSRKGEVAIAAFNSPTHLTLSGSKTAIESIRHEMKAAYISYLPLTESVAYHHPAIVNHITPDDFAPQPIKPHTALYSCTTGAQVTLENYSADHWVQNISKPVHFRQVMGSLSASGTHCYLEISCKPMLTPYLCALPGVQKHNVLNPLSVLSGVPENCQSLVKLFNAGYNVNWSAVYGQHPWTDLPTYPWQNERFWQEPEKSKKRRLQLVRHQMLGTLIDGQETQWQALLSTEKMPWLLEHHVMGDCLLPGATYVDMALAALEERAGGKSFAIENLRFLKAVRIQKKSAFFIRFSLDEKHGSFRIAATKALWPLDFEDVAEGRFRQLPPGSITAINPEEQIAVYEQKVSGVDMYRYFKSIYFEYGQTFQGLKQVYKKHNEDFCEITIPEQYCADIYRFHPVALDMVFHAALSLKYQTDDNEVRIELPDGIEEIRMFNQPETKMFVYAKRIEKSAQVSKTDLYIYSATGQPIGIITGFKTVSLASKNSGNSAKLPNQKTSAAPVWHEVDSTYPSIHHVQKKQFIILSEDHFVSKSLTFKLREAGHDVLSINTAFFQVDDDHMIIEELCSILNQNKYAEMINCMPLSVTSYGKAVTHVMKPFIYLARLIKAGVFAGKLWSVSQSAQQINGYLGDVNVFQSALWGITQVFGNQEFKENYSGVIDISDTEDTDALAHILSIQSHEEKQLAVRNGKIFARRLQPVDVALSKPLRMSFNPLATYMITGAFGAIGKEVVRWMVNKGVRNLLLTSSRDIAKLTQSEDILWLQQFKDQGCKLNVVTVDFDDKQSVINLKCQIAKIKISGLIYCAGVSEDQLLEDIDDKTLNKVLSAKAQGALCLHNLLLNQPLEHFVLFSSVGSLLPNRGMGAYAAANAMLDALAQKRKGMGLPALSINWGPWLIGMVQKAGLEKIFSLMGVNPLSAAQGIELLESVFYADYPQLLVQLTDWSKFSASSLFNNQLFEHYGDFSLQNERLNKSVSNINNLKADLLVELATLLNIQESDIDLSKSITDYDMESLSVMVLSDIIEERWGVTITVDELWMINSLNDLISKITVGASALFQETN